MMLAGFWRGSGFWRGPLTIAAHGAIVTLCSLYNMIVFTTNGTSYIITKIVDNEPRPSSLLDPEKMVEVLNETQSIINRKRPPGITKASAKSIKERDDAEAQAAARRSKENLDNIRSLKDAQSSLRNHHRERLLMIEEARANGKGNPMITRIR